MKVLGLFRHAKSDWGNPGLDDHDRPLNDRGVRDAPRMARGLAETGFRPEVILSSTALRALISDAVLRARLGAAARRSITEQGYTWDANAPRVVALLTGIREDRTAQGRFAHAVTDSANIG